jgi:uncharacterized protein (DUF302 family)
MYGFFTRLGGPVEEAIKRVSEALQAEGFGVLVDIDIQAALKAKLGVERRPYRILGACNPMLARQALEADPDIGLLLPCNVIVREEEDGSVTVGFMDPETVLALVQNERIAVLAKDVRARLERIREALTGVSSAYA